jgi:hypothetical protein
MNDDELDRVLARVPREVPPPADLWPAIAAGLEPRRRRWSPGLALAAGVAVAAVGGLVGWQVAHRRGPGTPPVVATVAPGTAAAPLLAAAFEAPQDERYRVTRAALETTFRERLGLLAPATRARIEQDLAVIRRANDDIRGALATDPNSPLLQQLLESTWQQEIDLYTTVNRTTEPALPRTRT